MMTKDYTIDELKNSTPNENFKFLPYGEQQKIMYNLHLVCENIKSRIENNKITTFYEKEHLYTFSLNIDKTELVEKYPEYFQDFHFLELHSKYRNTLKNKRKVDVKELDAEIINNHFLNLDLNNLEEFFNEWNKDVINNDNLSNDVKTNKNKLINELKREAKIQIKDYAKDLKDETLNTDYKLNSDYTMFILYTKFIYLLCSKIKEIFEIEKPYHTMIINKQKIRFTEMSLVHILIRHYSPLSKISQKNILKSNHKDDIPTEEIHLQLENIFKNIEDSDIIRDNIYFKEWDINKKPLNEDITFQFKGQIYRVWISLNLNKSERGQIAFKEIETFHPLDDAEDLKKLKSNYTKLRINENLYFYKRLNWF